MAGETGGGGGDENGDKIVLTAVSDLSDTIRQMQEMVETLRSLQASFKGTADAADTANQAVSGATSAIAQAVTALQSAAKVDLGRFWQQISTASRLATNDIRGFWEQIYKASQLTEGYDRMNSRLATLVGATEGIYKRLADAIQERLATAASHVILGFRETDMAIEKSGMSFQALVPVINGVGAAIRSLGGYLAGLGGILPWGSPP